MRVRQRLARQVVLLADELVVVQDIELLSGAHLLPTHQAGEAIQVENLVSRLPHEILRAYPLEATAAFRPVSPATERRATNHVNNDERSEFFFSLSLSLFSFKFVLDQEALKHRITSARVTSR